MNKQLPTALALILTVACTTASDTHIEYVATPNAWTSNHHARLSYHPSDTMTSYDIDVLLRHSERYQYNNIALVVSPSDTTLSVDTLRTTLADSLGHWLSDGVSIHSATIPYARRATFKDTTPVHFDITPALDVDTLHNILELGIQITPSTL